MCDVCQVDSNAASGFAGLPPEWAKLLEMSNITMNDLRENPNAVMDVIEFHTKVQTPFKLTHTFT